MSNIVENDFFGFPKVKWLQYTGKVGKCTSYRCQIYSGFHGPKIINIFDRVIWKIKGGLFWGYSVYTTGRRDELMLFRVSYMYILYKLYKFKRRCSMWYGGKIAFNESESLQIYCSNIITFINSFRCRFFTAAIDIVCDGAYHAGPRNLLVFWWNLTDIYCRRATSMTGIGGGRVGYRQNTHFLPIALW